ncbi:MAG: hypothetical protein R3B45_09360 [Bdellovibrionota bacterium]
MNNISGLGEEEVREKLASILANTYLNTLLSKAGKSKDEIIQILGREIGFALAAVLQEPLQRLVDGRKIRISIELVPKEAGHTVKKKKKKKANAKKRQ